MKNKKGFTLIELLAVVVVIGLLVAIAFPAVSKYTNETRNDAYSLHEAELKTATANMMSKCVQGDVDGCIPDTGGSRTVYLNELIAQKFSSAIKDPAKSNGYCDADKTYVVVTNTKNNVIDLEYQVCLVCSKYQSAVCETVAPDNKCDKTTDPDRPVCGDAIGSSTIWTNADRVISIGCSDTGCGCTQGTYYQRFEETAKQGVMTIIDKAGNTTDCVVDVYVDKEVPTCELEVVGTQGEHGWYGGTAPVVKFKSDPSKIKDTSGIATYGIGLSSKNPNLNKETSYTVSPGITTVYGYVKDNAGNVGMCKAEVKYDNVVPTSEITYGYRVYPKSDIATTSGQYINLNSFIKEYGNVLGANIYLKSNSGGMSVTIYKGSTEIAKRTISAGVKSMKFTFSGTYDSLKIDMGSVSNISLVDRIELITDHTSGFYTNKDIYVYATSHDSFSGKGYYSFDGEAWQESNRKTYTANVFAADARTKDFAGNISKKIEFTVNNIDKDKPKCTVTTDKAPDGKNNWFISNFGLTLNRWDNQYVTGTNVISEVRDYHITTSTTPSYGTTYKATQTEDTKLTTWHGYIRDRAGNVNTCSIDVKLDKVDPTCEVYPTKQPDGENGWYISTVDIKFSEVDVTSGVVFRDLTKSATPSYNMNTQLTLDYDTKGQMFYCYVEDEAGRTGDNKNSYKRDTVNPTCTITPDRNPDGLNSWYLSDVRLTLTTTSDISPITGYDLTTSTTVNYTGKRTTADITKSTNSITYYAYTKEESGRTSTCNKTIKIDEHNPTCTVTPSGTIGTNSWYTSNITLTLAYDDNESGVATGSGVKKYDVINSNVTKPSSYANKTVNTHTVDGTGIVYYGYVQDDAGRTGKCTSGTYKKDATKPNSCSINVSKNPDGDNGWYRSNVTLSLAATPGDNLSGVVAYEITSGTPGYGGKSNSYVVNTDSSSSSGTTYTAYIKDAAGNVQSCSKVIKRDTFVDCYLQKSGTPGISGWFISNTVNVILKPSSDASGIAKKGMNRSYSVDYNGTTSLSQSGYSTYKFFYGYVKDNAGNTNYCSTYIRGIDPSPPTCDITATGTKGSNDWFTSSTVTIKGEVSDTGSGLNDYGMNTSSVRNYNGDSLTITRYANTSSDGVTYYLYAMDKAGNICSDSVKVKKDSSKPGCYFMLDGSRGLNSYYTSNVDMEANYYDYNSGVASKALNQSTSASYTNMSGVGTNGTRLTKTHTANTTGTDYYCYVKDNAGNTNYSKKTIKKDVPDPTCTLTTSCGGSSSSSSKTWTSNCTVTVSVNGSDSTSGIYKSGVSKYSIPTYDSSSTTFNHDTYNQMKFYGYVMDYAGNVGTCTINTGRQSKNDSCTLTTNKSPDGENGWYKSSVTVTYTAYNYDSGFLGTGIGGSGYEVDSTNTSRMKFKREVYGSGSPSSLSLFAKTHTENGSYLYTGEYSETGLFNLLGYDDAYCYLMINKDSVAPTISVSSTVGSQSSPASTTAKVTLTATENHSGVAYWYYQYSDGGTWYRKSDSYGKKTYTFEYDYDGKYARNYKVCDVAGNCSSSVSATVYRAGCTAIPSNAKITAGTCSATCGSGKRKDVYTWTTYFGATCTVNASEDDVECWNYSGCGYNMANKVCMDYSDSKLFGDSIGSIRNGSTNNYESFDEDVGRTFTCYCGSKSLSTRSGYQRVCVGSSCGIFLGRTLSAMTQQAAEEVASGYFAKNYCAEKLPYWCSCESGRAIDYYSSGYIFRPFVQDVLSISGKCSWLTSEDKQVLRPSDPCYGT